MKLFTVLISHTNKNFVNTVHMYIINLITVFSLISLIAVGKNVFLKRFVAHFIACILLLDGSHSRTARADNERDPVLFLKLLKELFSCTIL